MNRQGEGQRGCGRVYHALGKKELTCVPVETVARKDTSPGIQALHVCG